MGQTCLCGGGKSCTNSHHIINQQNITTCEKLFVAWMGLESIGNIGKAAHPPPTILTASGTAAYQQIRAMRQSQLSRQFRTEQRRLIVAPPCETQPMQRDRSRQHIRPDKRPRCTRHPDGGRPHKIMPIMVLEPEDDLRSAAFIEHSRPALLPGPGKGEAFIAMQRRLARITRKRQTATVAATATYERHLPPALPAK